VTDPRDDTGATEKARLDRWLWAARLYKTRALAAEAVDGGKVRVNEERVKRSRLVQVGDQIDLRQGPYQLIVVVRALSTRRGPARMAVTLYEETVDSVAARERVALQLKTANALFVTETEARPTKRDRRRLDRFRRDSGWK